jgi:hypothetical protein
LQKIAVTNLKSFFHLSSLPSKITQHTNKKNVPQMKSLEVHQSAREPNQSISSPPQLQKADGSTPVRRSTRLNALHSSKNETQSRDAADLEEKDDSESVEISGRKRDYESIRNARISENMVGKLTSFSLFLYQTSLFFTDLMVSIKIL